MVQDRWGDPSTRRSNSRFRRPPRGQCAGFCALGDVNWRASDAETLCAIAKNHGALTVVDTVTTLAGIDLQVDNWGADAVYSGTQKCLSCVPGLSPMTFSPAAVDRIQQRPERVQSWFLDMQLVMGYWGGDSKRAYHHTAPVNALMRCMRHCLLSGRKDWRQLERHRNNHLQLVAGLERMGLEMAVAPEWRLLHNSTPSVSRRVSMTPKFGVVCCGNSIWKSALDWENWRANNGALA